MAIYKTIKNFSSQFLYQPIIENFLLLKPFKKFIVVGMGGSHLAADLLKVWNPNLELIVHQDYGLPSLSDKELRKHLIILSSYSGNTEEVIDAYEIAGKKKLFRVVISTGGKLIELAKKDNVSFIQIPATKIQPRLALGFNLKALLKIIGEKRALKEVTKLSTILKPIEFKEEGRRLAQKLKGFVPVIYSSLQNLPIAYNWKVKFNETAKIPSFYNVFSELNHNEMTGFDVKFATKKLSKVFSFILLKDKEDHPKIIKRMEILAKLYRNRNLPVIEIKLISNQGIFYKIFSSLVLADWAAYYTSQVYGVEPEQVPMVEEFKELVMK